MSDTWISLGDATANVINSIAEKRTMTNASIKTYADQLSDILMRIEDAKVEAASIIEAAKEAGIDTKALKKVAKELTMQSDKLHQRFEDEAQLSLFRDQVGLRQRKGLAGDKPTIAYYKEAKDGDEIVEFLAGHRRA